jgi:hypothetical protein
VLLAAVAAIGSPSVSFGDLLFDGSEFQINTYTTSYQDAETARSVARNADGSFVVVWKSRSQDGSPADNIHGQRFDSTGAPAGTEFRANTYTTDAQRSAAVATAGDGRFVVVWTSFGQDGDHYGVFGQRFDSAGAPAGTEFQINSHTTSFQFGPAVSSASDGSFVVVWTSTGQDGSVNSVQGQRFNSTGAPAGTEFQVNSYTTYAQFGPAVSSAPDGRFVVVWMAFSQDGSVSGVHGQRFNSAGAPAGTEFQVNSYTTNEQSGPAISVATDGSFVVAWNSYLQDGSGLGVHGQRFNAAGAPAGTEFQVSSYTTEDQFEPAVSALADGSFAVAWTSGDVFNAPLDVHARRFNSSGAPAGTEFRVNSSTAAYQSSIAADADGDFIVVWTNYREDSDLEVSGQLLTQKTTTACGAAPAVGCLGGAKASFQVKDDANNAKDQVKWTLQKGDAFDQLLLGDPANARTHTLCIYDETAGVPSLVALLKIGPNPSWEDETPKGFKYKDKQGAEDGVTTALLKAGAAGKTKVSVLAKGLAVPMPAPLSLTEFFDVDSSVTVQLINDETSTCWTTEFTTVKTNTASQFKASAP